MSSVPTDIWPWLTFAGLGAFHGLNPAMGWLFAVALGLHRQSRTIVMTALVPIAFGHAASIIVVAGLLAMVGYLVPHDFVRVGSGALLLGCAAYHWRFGHRHRVRFGMQVGLWGLAAWSFLMATAHGAGLMLWPALMHTCFIDTGSGQGGYFGPLATTLAGVGVHTLAMLVTTAIVAGLVYAWLGLALLRHAWFNVDAIWVAALVGIGTLLLTDAL